MTSSNSTNTPDLVCVIMAAGQGTRMNSDLPKVLHRVAGRTLVSCVLDAAMAAGATRPVVVIGHGGDQVRAAVAPHQTVVQEPQHGTGDAVKQVGPVLADFDGDVFALNGDGPLITMETLTRMREARARADLVLLGFHTLEPGAYGRMIVGADGMLDRIVEPRDANADELAVTLCNAGSYLADREVLFGLLDRVTNDNARGEFYITDIVGLARADDLTCAVIECDETETMGINSRKELAAAEQVVQERLRTAAMEAGATLIDPGSVWLNWDTEMGRDVVIGQNVVFGAGVRVEDGVTIKSFCHLEDCILRSGAMVGPFARVRGGAELAEGAKLGNFVEVKKAQIGAGARINHLSYVGDAVIGAGANIGAGTITCNYNGFEKNVTEIGEGAFIGSNTLLIAPVKVGQGALTGSGTVVTEDVPDDALALTRPPLTVKEKWAARFRAAWQRKMKTG